MLKKLILAISATLFCNAASAATYDPFGVQNDVATATVYGGGWTTIYQDLYDQRPVVPIANLFVGAGSQIMLAAKRVGSATFDVLASMDAAIFIGLHTAPNATLTANGAEWYKNGYSMGFAGLGDIITQSSADTNGLDERDRLSWHTEGGAANPATDLQYGWRSGDNVWLNDASDWERHVLTNTITPVPLPAGLPLLVGALGGLFALRRRKTA